METQSISKPSANVSHSSSNQQLTTISTMATRVGSIFPTIERSSSTVGVLSGSSHPELANSIAKILTSQTPQPLQYVNLTIGNASVETNYLVPMTVDRFSNGEVRVDINQSVRGKDLFVVQTGSSSSTQSVNDVIMETMVIIDACRRSDAKSVTLIMAHYPYSRQDKKDRPRAPISAKVVATMLERVAKIDRLIVMDLHASQIQGFFDRTPVDNLYAMDLLIEHLRSKVLILASPTSDTDTATTTESSASNDKYVLVSPDAGGAKRVFAYGKKLSLPTVIMHKQRDHSQKSHIESTLLIGDHDCVRDKVCIVIDDMVDTLGTVVQACDSLVNQGGAKSCIIVATHGVLSGPAIERLNACDHISQLIVTDTIPQISGDSQGLTTTSIKSSKIRVVETASLFARAISAIVNGGSISALFV